jgi:hypothetical protein
MKNTSKNNNSTVSEIGKGEVKITKLPAIPIDRMTLTIVGVTPLLMNNFSEKSKEQMANKQQGVATAAREKKDPKALYEAAKYRDDSGRDCVTAIQLKSSIVGSARFHEGFKMTELKGGVYVAGNLLPLTYDTVVMREDHVRNATGVADLRYRPEYTGWSFDVTLEFNRGLISAEQMMSLIRLAGRHQGIGEWRPEKGGVHGRYDIDISKGVLVRGVDEGPVTKVA